ncbi:MAG: TetR family transcriptional regulator [Pseudomonadota bacterium]
MKSTHKLSARDAIIEAAFTVFSRDPSAPLADVVRQSGVGRATLHRHFSTRDSLITQLAHLAISETDEAVEHACEGLESHAEAIHRTLEVLIPLGDRHGFLALQPVNENSELAMEYKRQDAETREMIEGAKQERLFDPSVPTDWILQTFEHLIYAAWESVRLESITPNQAAELAWRTLTAGLGDNR